MTLKQKTTFFFDSYPAALPNFSLFAFRFSMLLLPTPSDFHELIGVPLAIACRPMYGTKRIYAPHPSEQLELLAATAGLPSPPPPSPPLPEMAVHAAPAVNEPAWHNAWREDGKSPAAVQSGGLTLAPLGFEDKTLKAPESVNMHSVAADQPQKPSVCKKPQQQQQQQKSVQTTGSNSSSIALGSKRKASVPLVKAIWTHPKTVRFELAVETTNVQSPKKHKTEHKSGIPIKLVPKQQKSEGERRALATLASKRTPHANFQVAMAENMCLATKAKVLSNVKTIKSTVHGTVAYAPYIFEIFELQTSHDRKANTPHVRLSLYVPHPTLGRDPVAEVECPLDGVVMRLIDLIAQITERAIQQTKRKKKEKEKEMETQQQRVLKECEAAHTRWIAAVFA